jgi:hypothetical protein
LGRLTFDEKADIKIDIKDRDDDFHDCLEEVPSGEDAKKGYRYVKAGTSLRSAAAGFKTLSGMMGDAWRNDDDDLGAVPTKAVDADDMRTYMSLGSDAYNASMKPISNGFGTAGTPVVRPLTPAVENKA